MQTASMAAASTHAPSTNTHENPAVEPAAWLKAFEALGGGYAVGDHFLRLCILLGSQTDAELSMARVMIKGLSLDDRAAIYSHLRGDAAMMGEA